jgi:hypothetical protein
MLTGLPINMVTLSGFIGVVGVGIITQPRKSTGKRSTKDLFIFPSRTFQADRSGWGDRQDENRMSTHTENNRAQRPIPPLERVEFTNGLEATLQEDGTLRIMATARGLRAIAIFPSADNSCRVGVIGEIYKARKS